MIRVEGLTKVYGTRVAVDDVSFSAASNEIVGFLGPNGAGKTTTMRIITGYLMPTRGDVWVAGHDMSRQSLEARRLIGYLPEIVPLYGDMSTRDYLAYVGRLRGLDRRRTRSRIDEVVSRCGLEEYVDVLLARLSKGFRQRVGLAQAIINDPRVLVLDEPTIGIDPLQVAQTRELIRELGKERTILLSTHVLPEVSMVCERALIIHRGRIVAQDRIENLSAILKGGGRLRLEVQGPAAAVTERLGRIAGVASVRYQVPHHVVEYLPGVQPQANITRAMVENGWTLLTMEAVGRSLEDVFLELTAEEARGP